MTARLASLIVDLMIEGRIPIRAGLLMLAALRWV
jgi:hypothetical protein